MLIARGTTGGPAGFRKRHKGPSEFCQCFGVGREAANISATGVRGTTTHPLMRDGADFHCARNGGTVAKLAIGKLPGGDEIKAVLISPLGVYLAGGAALKLDGTKEIKGVYTHCNTTGCFGEFPLSTELIAQMRAAKAITLGIFTVQRAPLVFDVSLKGFGPAYDAALAPSH